MINENEYQQLENGRKLYHPIKVFFLQDELEVPEKKSKRDFLFQLNEIIPDFEMILSKWFSFDHEMLPIIRHMIDSVSKKKVFRSSDFLILIQALEGFHTRFRIGTVNKPKILLIDRLKSLYNEFSTIKAIKDIEFDFECVTNTRHYYSHFFFKKKKIAEGIALYEMTRDLKKLLICCILRETGFTTENIGKFVKAT